MSMVIQVYIHKICMFKCTWHLADGRRVIVYYTRGKHTRYQLHSADKRPHGNDMCVVNVDKA